MDIRQFVMAYSVEQDRLRAALPDGFFSLRPVLRINAEIIDGEKAHLEFNTAVEIDGKKGWLNIAVWDNIAFSEDEKSATFKSNDIEIIFKPVGIKGSCPAEKDNCGCWFLPNFILRKPEIITSEKEFCDCSFKWNFENGANGKSIGKTLPAIPTEIKKIYPKIDFSPKSFAEIKCEQVLGSYVVNFTR